MTERPEMWHDSYDLGDNTDMNILLHIFFLNIIIKKRDLDLVSWKKIEMRKEMNEWIK